MGKPDRFRGLSPAAIFSPRFPAATWPRCIGHSSSIRPGAQVLRSELRCGSRQKRRRRAHPAPPPLCFLPGLTTATAEGHGPWRLPVSRRHRPAASAARRSEVCTRDDRSRAAWSPGSNRTASFCTRLGVRNGRPQRFTTAPRSPAEGLHRAERFAGGKAADTREATVAFQRHRGNSPATGEVDISASIACR